MVLQQDTLEVSTDIAVQGDSVVPKHKPITPATVLSWLPYNATPA